MWMLRDDCLDEAIVKLTNLLTAKDMCTASNAALVLARYFIIIVLQKTTEHSNQYMFFSNPYNHGNY